MSTEVHSDDADRNYTEEVHIVQNNQRLRGALTASRTMWNASIQDGTSYMHRKPLDSAYNLHTYGEKKVSSRHSEEDLDQHQKYTYSHSTVCTV